MYFGKIIKLFRKNSKKTQVELASLLDITPEYLSKLENGSKTPSIELLKKLSQILDIPLPLFLFLSTDESDLTPEKRERFNQFKPVIDQLLIQIFDEPILDVDSIGSGLKDLSKLRKEGNAQPA